MGKWDASPKKRLKRVQKTAAPASFDGKGVAERRPRTIDPSGGPFCRPSVNLHKKRRGVLAEAAHVSAASAKTPRPPLTGKDVRNFCIV